MQAKTKFNDEELQVMDTYKEVLELCEIPTEMRNLLSASLVMRLLKGRMSYGPLDKRDNSVAGWLTEGSEEIDDACVYSILAYMCDPGLRAQMLTMCEKLVQMRCEVMSIISKINKARGL